MSPRSMAAALAASLVLTACGVTHDPSLETPQPVVGLPDRFVAADPSLPPSPAVGCLGRLVDPKGATQLTLERSGKRATAPETYWGDYALNPSGQYGVPDDRLVRIECGTGRPLGTVPRKT